MTPYEQLQQAMIDASERDAEVWAERNRLGAKCATLLHELLQRLQAELGLPPEDAARQVFFRDPTGKHPDPDEPSRVLNTELFDHTIRLDVEIKAPQGRGGHVLCVMLKIREHNETQYRITFEGGSEEHTILVDTADPCTFDQFSHRLIAAMLEWFNTDLVGRNSRYVRSPAGFALGAYNPRSDSPSPSGR